jgi:hypothetical protein
MPTHHDLRCGFGFRRDLLRKDSQQDFLEVPQRHVWGPDALVVKAMAESVPQNLTKVTHLVKTPHAKLAESISG